jgi:hypothetical protein
MRLSPFRHGILWRPMYGTRLQCDLVRMLEYEIRLWIGFNYSLKLELIVEF